MINIVMQPTHVRLCICPSCGAKLGISEKFKQKAGKPYKCGNCGRQINEKYVVH